MPEETTSKPDIIQNNSLSLPPPETFPSRVWNGNLGFEGLTDSG